METIEEFVRSLPGDKRKELTEQLQHSCSLYTLEGAHWLNPVEREDLLAVLLARERYMVDTNSNWKSESAKPENREKAFIIGRTVTDEQPNLKGLLFGSTVNIENNNLFIIAPEEINGKPFIQIERLDS